MASGRGRCAGAIAGRAVEDTAAGFVKPGVPADPVSPTRPKCRATPSARYTWFGRTVVALRADPLGQPAQSVQAPPLGPAADAIGRARPHGDGPARRRSRRQHVAEHVEALPGHQWLPVLEGANEFGELDHHGVGAHEAQPARRVGGHGDASARQLRLQGPERAVELDEVVQHVRG